MHAACSMPACESADRYIVMGSQENFLSGKWRTRNGKRWINITILLFCLRRQVTMAMMANQLIFRST